VKKKQCAFCQCRYKPDPRTYRHQLACSKLRCRRKRKSHANQKWIKKQPDYGRYRTKKIHSWARSFPNYWQEYRRNHPEYTKRDNRRRALAMKKARRALRQNMRMEKIVQILKSFPRFQPKDVFKQTNFDPRVDAILEYIALREGF
jgi:hypothetical protein